MLLKLAQCHFINTSKLCNSTYFYYMTKQQEKPNFSDKILCCSSLDKREEIKQKTTSVDQNRSFLHQFPVETS